MSKFLVFTHESGEIIFIRRDSITSFHPKFVSKNNYCIYVTVGPERFPIKRCESMDEAKIWVNEQIDLIEKKVDGI